MPRILSTPPGAPFRFEVAVQCGLGFELGVAEAGGASRDYRLPRRDQTGWLDLQEALARDFGLRWPLARSAPPQPRGAPPLRALLTEPVAPQILYGYGDPCVLRVGEGDYRLVVTSNDAPNAFPILSSSDLADWRLSGFVFPEGHAPPWTLTGPEVSDFWAPEMHRIGREYWVCFSARAHDRSLAIGLARSGSPDGPFEADPEPIVAGGVIDAHLLVDGDRAPWLVWKRDDNGVWPRALAELLHRRPQRVTELFPAVIDQRTACLALTLWPWTRGLEPMEQFFVLQPLIEGASEAFAAFAERIAALRGRADAEEAADLARIAAALTTRIYAQRLAPDGRGLVGAPTVILQNDQPWEAHLIEGVWIAREAGRYHLLYAGNDFSTARYAIGAAVADAPDGPYRKSSEVFLASTHDWWGPGHPSIALAPDGRRHVFLHAFRPGEMGYKAFRALLAAPVSFERDVVQIDPRVVLT